MKEQFCLTDEELMDRMLFDALFQHALGTSSFEEQPVSDRTFSRFRERLYNYEMQTGRDLIQEEMESLAQGFIQFSKTSSSLRRMDSLMVSSSCKKMSRLEILYTCVANMVKELFQKEYPIPEDLLHYLEEEDRNRTIYHRRSEELSLRLQQVIEDAIKLLAQVPETLLENESFRLLMRVLREQTT